MALRRLALLGTRVSPWVCLAHMKSPHLRVRGLPVEAILFAEVYDKDNTLIVIVEVGQDGRHPLPEGEWLIVKCDRARRDTICDVIAKVA
jgi:hypothetical protein